MPSLFNLLQEQYSATEDYCNAQTALRNVVVSRQEISADGSAWNKNHQRLVLNQALRQHQKSHDRLHSNLQALKQQESYMSASSNISNPESSYVLRSTVPVDLLSQHIRRSQRILETIYYEGGGAYHPNGLAKPMTTDSISTTTTSNMMVALSTLRASIQLVQDHLTASDNAVS
jgi:hypothetical protein